MDAPSDPLQSHPGADHAARIASLMQNEHEALLESIHAIRSAQQTSVDKARTMLTDTERDAPAPPEGDAPPESAALPESAAAPNDALLQALLAGQHSAIEAAAAAYTESVTAQQTAAETVIANATQRLANAFASTAESPTT